LSVSQIGGIKGTVVPSPFVVRSKEQPIKVRSTDTVSAYKRCRCYAPWLALGLLFLQTGSMLTHLIGIAATTDLWHTLLILTLGEH